MPSLFQITEFLKYYLSARTKYSIHSPFVTEFVTNVLDNHRRYYAFYPLQYLREQLKKDKTQIRVQDMGAGSQVYVGKDKTIGQIARSSLSSIWQCKIMFHLVNYYQPNHILELGTSLGISSLYMSKANGRAHITTIEGDPEVAHIAETNFARLDANNIDLKIGHFDMVLRGLDSSQQYDLIFVDGNHKEEATISYFEQLYPLLTEKGMIIFDDIYWSPGMRKAWQHIRREVSSELVIDLYYFGIIFKNSGLAKGQYFRLIPYWWKPFDLGIFGKKQ